ncbi:MAG: FAD-dependent oxidoreductase, partial [Caldimonas sp.]
GFDSVVVAASAVEAARLVAPHAPHWASQAAALRYEPIVTVYARSAGCRLPEPMLAFAAVAEGPSQFVFDRGRLGGEEGLLALVASGAAPWVERGADVTARAALEQARIALGAHLRAPLELVRTIVEKRATFACTPGLERPPALIGPGFFAAGDYVEGPYPATLEGAVRSGVKAARASLLTVRGENSA